MATAEECRALIAEIEQARGRSLTDDLIARSGGDLDWLRRALDERSPEVGAPVDLWLDLREGCVTGPTGRHELTAQRRAMLALFAEAGSDGVTLEELYLRLWGGPEYHPLNHRAVLYTAIARFRRALEPLFGCDPLQRLGETRYRITSRLTVGIRPLAAAPLLYAERPRLARSSDRAASADRPPAE